MSDLDKWLNEKELYIKKSENEIESHKLFHHIGSSYKGNMLYIPKKLEQEFYKRYTNEIIKGSPLYFIETRPEIFRYMIDFDIADDHFWSDEEVINICKIANKIINQFYPNLQLSAIILKSDKQKIKFDQNNKENIHTGIHFFIPKLFVIAEVALIIRKGIIKELDTLTKKSWASYIDDCVYKSNGFRMYGSDKYDRKLKSPENRLYKLLTVIDYNGEFLDIYYNRLINNQIDIVRETSIRNVPEYISNGQEPILPSWYENTMPMVKSVKSNHKAGLISNDKHVGAVWYLIKKAFPEYTKYGLSLIKNVYKYPEQNGHSSLLIVTNCKYCLNMDKEHKSCGIYFHIGFRKGGGVGLCQKCLCPCDNLNFRKNGLCKNFTSTIYKLKYDEAISLGFGISEKHFRNNDIPVVSDEIYNLYKNKEVKEDLEDLEVKEVKEEVKEVKEEIKEIKEEIKEDLKEIKEKSAKDIYSFLKIDTSLKIETNRRKSTEKSEKSTEKSEKTTEKSEKSTEKSTEKTTEKTKKKAHEDDPAYIYNPESKMYVKRDGSIGQKLLGIGPKKTITGQKKSKNNFYEPATPEKILRDSEIECGNLMKKLANYV